MLMLSLSLCLAKQLHSPVVTYQNLSVKEDYDGEDRMLDLEMVLELPIQIYEKKVMVSE